MKRDFFSGKYYIKMDTQEIGNGWFKTIEHHSVIGSTNDRAMELLKDHPSLPLPGLVYADEQTAGKGRGAKNWWTGPGSIAMTLILDAKVHHLKRQTVSHLSLGCGLAVLKTLTTIIPDKKIDIHWPNDVYVEGRKISGILIESPSPRHFVIGIGLNTNNSMTGAPEKMRPQLVTLRDILGREVENRSVMNHLLREIALMLDHFPDRLKQLTQEVQSHLFQLHHHVTLMQNVSAITGQCLGIAEDASLRILTDQGEKNFVTGILDGEKTKYLELEDKNNGCAF